METYTRADLVRGLREVGLSRGDLVLFQSRLHGLGRPEGVSGKEELCRFFLDALREIIGAEGTLVVPTFTTQVARQDLPFVVEETVPNYGLFPEYVFRHPDFVRSLHPIWSFAATGPLKERICRSGCTSSFGLGSPLDMVVRLGGKNVFCGLEIREATTIIHYVEAHYGVPYIYNKLLKWRPIEKGVAAEQPYYGSVRYLEYDIAWNPQPYQDDLVSRGLARSAQVGGGPVHALAMTDMVEVGCAGLRRDPGYFLARSPDFDYGRLPFDGPSLAGEEQRRAAAGGALGVEGLEAVLDRARAAAPRLAELLRAVADRSTPSGRKNLLKSLAGKRERFFAEGERLAVALLGCAGKRGKGVAEVAGAYLQLCADTAQEQMAFRRQGAYTLSDFGDAQRQVYDNREAMESYMDGLLLSQVLWDNHWSLLRFARNEFFAPHCLKSPLHVEIGPGHGWFLVMAFDFGVQRAVAFDVSDQSLEHTAVMLESQGVSADRWELRKADAQKGLGLADASVSTLVAGEVLEHIADPAGLLREIRRVLVPGGAALVTTAANAPAKDHIFLFNSVDEIRAMIRAAGLGIERDLSVEIGRIGDKPLVNYAAVLRKPSG
jgi:aminoglycoside 3-N-acetyltransferase